MDGRKEFRLKELKNLFKLIDDYFEAASKPLKNSSYEQFKSIAEDEARK